MQDTVREIFKEIEERIINIETKTYDIYYVCERLTEKLKPKGDELINVYLCNVKRLVKPKNDI